MLAQRGIPHIQYIALISVADSSKFQVNPTIAAGDFQISLDGGTFVNLATLPVVTPAGGRMVKITLSAAEMTADSIVIQAVDAAGAEWHEVIYSVDLVRDAGSLTVSKFLTIKQ